MGTTIRTKWYKNNNITTGTTSNNYIISSFTSDDIGSYTCKIQNSSFTSLTLESMPLNVANINQTYDITFTITDGTNSIENAEISLYGYNNQTTNSLGITTFTNVQPKTNITYTISAKGFDNFSERLTVINSNIEINISNLSNGIYIIKTVTNNRTLTKRFVKK